jgi:hypothetical protein
LPLTRDGSRIGLNHHKSRPATLATNIIAASQNTLDGYYKCRVLYSNLTDRYVKVFSGVRINMSPYQHIFSTNAVLGVWRNLRNHRDQNDLLLTFQYQPDDLRTQNGKRHEKGYATETSHEVSDAKTVDAGGKSIGFVVPWRSMQAQRKELREKEKELAEALVVLTGEVAFTGTRPIPSIDSSFPY